MAAIQLPFQARGGEPFQTQHQNGGILLQALPTKVVFLYWVPDNHGGVELSTKSGKQILKEQ